MTLLQEARSHRAVEEPERDGALPAFELIGPDCAPVIVVLGGISATRHVVSSEHDPSPGWWDDIVGPGRAIDTNAFRVLGIDFLDGGRRDDGQPERIVTTVDQADAIACVLDALDIERVYAFVGASYGGMVALAFAETYPDRIERVVAISAPHEPHPMSTALRAIQRRIVRLGLSTGRAHDALAIARGLAITTYRSGAEFAERFDSAPDLITENDAVFPVESYLSHHGERFAARWTPERFLALSLSGDLHRVDPRAIRTPAVIVAAEGDAIVPRQQLEDLVAHLAGPARLVDLPSTRGHDAFLTEPRELGRILDNALSIPNFS
ncbi:MAG TPA: homoserine O-succinyltransferase [Gemmatimonadaceae bacterium]|nr:homoserine O-succinyltransferase [Gemmatimonadaceae bacterium]